MKRFFFALMLVCGLAYGQTTPPIIERQFYDDTYVHVPLQFGFPFYGRTFTNSWMHSNGVVSFLDPAVPVPNTGQNPGQWAYCCEGVPPTTNTPQFSYMIAPLWTDLYPVGQSRFRTQGDATFQRYYWENIAEISNMSNLNTFGLEIRPSGYIGALYEHVNIQNQNTWVGTIGDPTLGQWNQIYYGRGIPQGAVQNWSMNDTPASQCQINPLSSPACPGYTEAMCSTNPLYSSSCSGYQQAYFTQQCSANSLYNINCPGYATAYLNYQCSVNPLYSTTCQGYENAYFDQQCSADALYSTNCPGYEQAYLNDQCIRDSLYSNRCEGYATAYAIKYLVTNIDSTAVNQSLSNTAATKANDPTNTVVATNTASTTVSSDGTVSTGVSTTGDTNVDKAISAKASSPSGSQPAAAVQLTAPPPAAVAQRQEQKQDEKKADNKPESGNDKPSGGPSQQAQSNDSGGSKPAAPTARQELQAKREAAAKAKAVEDGKNLASNMGKAADIEAQKQIQNVVIAAMGYTPGFDAYRMSTVPDGANYKPYVVYANQKNVDNRRVSWGLMGPSDKLHAELVDSQYNRGK